MTVTNGSPKRSTAQVAVGAGLTALLLMLIGTYLDTPFRTYGSEAHTWALETEGEGIGDLLVLVAFALIGAGVIFGLVVDRALRLEPERTAVRSLIVAVVGVVSLVVFWAGLPAILAAGAAVLALNARTRLGRTPATAGVALVLAALTIFAAILVAFTG